MNTNDDIESSQRQHYETMRHLAEMDNIDTVRVFAAGALKPSVRNRGNVWRIKYGDVEGTGKSAYDAMLAWNKAWHVEANSSKAVRRIVDDFGEHYAPWTYDEVPEVFLGVLRSSANSEFWSEHVQIHKRVWYADANSRLELAKHVLRVLDDGMLSVCATIRNVPEMHEHDK